MSRPRYNPRSAAVAIIRGLHDAGHVAYLAGGCVRDALLGLSPKDYDIATDAHPLRVRELLPKSRYVGEAFGVVLVHQFGFAIEVATFRREAGYEDKRRPSEVVFTDAEHDALRRDFTINGLFADPLARDPQTDTDRIIDYVGGRADLEARRLRAIGDPGRRFAEDYLRMLRAARFAARLDFTIEPGTAAAIRPLAKYLGQISRERIGQEIALMLLGPRPAAAAQWVQNLRLDAPALGEEHRDADLPTLTALADQSPAAPPLAVALAAWLIDRHAPGRDLAALATFCAPPHHPQTRLLVRRWRKALCLSNRVRDELNHIFLLLARARQWPGLNVAQRRRLLAEPDWPLALAVLRCLDLGPTLDQLETQARKLQAQGIAPAPLATGDDLIKMGAQPGPDFRRLLDSLYDAQLSGIVRTRRQALDWLAQHADSNH